MWILIGWIELKFFKFMKFGCLFCMEVRSLRGKFFGLVKGLVLLLIFFIKWEIDLRIRFSIVII